MPLDTRLTRELGIRAPIVSAPMAGVSGGALAAQVSRAGGFGFVAAGYLPEAEIIRQLKLAEGERTGVGFITWRVNDDRSTFDAVLESRSAAVFLSFGDAAGLVDPIRKTGAKLFMQVQTLSAAQDAAALGADVIVVQGSEAGGHGARRALGPLLDEVVEADLGPIILAAGGIANGRSMASALIRGADGVLCGTAFYAAQESLAHSAAKNRALTTNGDETERSDLFDAAREIAWPGTWTLRAARNAFSRKWRNAAGFAHADDDARKEFTRAAANGDFDTAPLIVGEGVGLLNSKAPASEILKQIEREAVDVLQRATAYWKKAMIELYSWNTSNGRKVSIALEEMNLPYAVHPIDIYKGDQFSEEFTAVTPNNKIPAIKDPDTGLTIFESGAILLYLADKSGKFLSSEPVKRWETIQWVMWQMGGFGPILGQTAHFLRYNAGVSEYSAERFLTEAKRLYSVLNGLLATREYIAHDYSIADMAIWPWVSRFEHQTIDLAEYPNVLEWYWRVAQRPAVLRGYAVPDRNEKPAMPA